MILTKCLTDIWHEVEPNRPQTPVSSKSPNCSTPSARLATTSESNYLADIGVINLWDHCHLYSKIWEEPSGQSNLFGFITRLGKQSAVLSILISQEYSILWPRVATALPMSHSLMRWPLGQNYQYALTLQNHVCYLFIPEMIHCIPGITRKDMSTSLRLEYLPQPKFSEKLSSEWGRPILSVCACLTRLTSCWLNGLCLANRSEHYTKCRKWRKGQWPSLRDLGARWE